MASKGQREATFSSTWRSMKEVASPVRDTVLGVVVFCTWLKVSAVVSGCP